MTMSDMPERVKLSRQKGWRIPEGTIIVSRPSHWGNPFKVYQHCKPGMLDGKRHEGDWGVEDTGRLGAPMGHGWTRLGAHKAAVAAYRKVVEEQYPESMQPYLVLALGGHDLACWCPLDLPCHADVLLELANDPKHAELLALRDAEAA